MAPDGGSPGLHDAPGQNPGRTPEPAPGSGLAPGTDSLPAPAPDLRTDRPHAGRMYDYYLGGTTNFPADRALAGRVLAAFPGVLASARANRQFMHRSVRHIAADLGMRQYLDLGSGIPTPPHIHEVAQESVPAARVVYCDDDPIVLAHARPLLDGRPEGRTAYVHGDIRDTAALLASDAVRDTLDLTRPVALSLFAVLHLFADDDAPYETVEQLKAAVPSGSTLTLSHGTADLDPEGMARLVATYAEAGIAVTLRTREQFARFFDGWELLEPGVTVHHRWRRDPERDLAQVTDAEAAGYGAVARKP